MSEIELPAEPTNIAVTAGVSSALQKDLYQAAMYSQLVLHGLTHEVAADRAKTAADYLTLKKLPYPVIVVG